MYGTNGPIFRFLWFCYVKGVLILSYEFTKRPSLCKISSVILKLHVLQVLFPEKVGELKTQHFRLDDVTKKKKNWWYFFPRFYFERIRNDNSLIKICLLQNCYIL